MQNGYRYELTAPAGRNFDQMFRPDLTPKQMLELGVFCGKYLTDCQKEFPASWFRRAKLSLSVRDCALNYFGVDASQPLSVWRKKGWIYPNDPRGWEAYGGSSPLTMIDRSLHAPHEDAQLLPAFVAKGLNRVITFVAIF
ncbi:MAG: hypothetical protein ABI146_04605 [Nitrobacter sp.]